MLSHDCVSTAGRTIPPTRKHEIRHSFTLIEVLLAVLLGSAVITVSGMVAVQSVSLQRASQVEVRKRWDRARVFWQFERDLNAALTWLPEDVVTVRVAPKPGRILEVLCLADVPAVDSPVGSRVPVKVSYIVENDPIQSDRKRLLREVRDLTRAHGTMHRRAVAEALMEVGIEMHTEAGWTSTLSLTGPPAREPTAVRLSCQWESTTGKQMRTVVLNRRASRS